MPSSVPAARKALAAAFPYTVPILAGFLFLGVAYGVYANTSGFSPLFPFLMSLTIFAGSMEFVTVSLLLGAFHPLSALFLTLMVNARHVFYGLSMLERYQNTGRKKWYLVFGLCDESFSINCSVRVPEGVDCGWFYFFTTLLNHLYWVAGATLGGVFGSLLSLPAKGLDFVLTALLFVIFLDQWTKERRHFSSLMGIVLSSACLLLFGSGGFILPAMLAILAALTLFRGRLSREGELE